MKITDLPLIGATALDLLTVSTASATLITPVDAITNGIINSNRGVDNLINGLSDAGDVAGSSNTIGVGNM